MHRDEAGAVQVVPAVHQLVEVGDLIRVARRAFLGDDVQHGFPGMVELVERAVPSPDQVGGLAVSRICVDFQHVELVEVVQPVCGFLFALERTVGIGEYRGQLDGLALPYRGDAGREMQDQLEQLLVQRQLALAAHLDQQAGDILVFLHVAEPCQQQPEWETR